MKIAEMNETFAVEFSEKFEYEWARKLIFNAIALRKKIHSMILPPVEDDDEEAPPETPEV